MLLLNLTSHLRNSLQIGAFHTLELELQRPFVLRKVFLFNFMLPVTVPFILLNMCFTYMQASSFAWIYYYAIVVTNMNVTKKEWGGGIFRKSICDSPPPPLLRIMITKDCIFPFVGCLGLFRFGGTTAGLWYIFSYLNLPILS